VKRKQTFLATCLVLSLACGCGDEGPAVPQAPPPFRLPGGLAAPDGAVVDVSADSSAIVYYWLPLDGYRPAAVDLAGINDARRQGRAVFPVQFDPESRNAAQTQVNELEVSIPVYLADSSLAAAIPCDILPVAVLFAIGRAPRSEAGEGCVSRLLDL
jgi:hypothetical protein